MLFASDPRANYRAHKKEIDSAVQRVLKRGRYVLGEEVEAFEQEFSRYIGTRFAVGVGSGTDALQLAIRASGIGPGDAIITVSHTAVATVAAIELTGSAVVLVDIDLDTYTMDPGRLEQAIHSFASSRSSFKARLKAILPVHLYGHPANMTAICEIAKRHNLHVIEDCAQSHGAEIEGRKTGAWGNVAAFSFYPTKNMGALGDAGAVATNDEHLAEKVRRMREYGWRQRYVSESPGTNSRLDELQAAILRVKLRHLDRENDRRRRLAGLYCSLLSRSQLILPRAKPNVTHVYHQFVVRSTHRDGLRSFLTANSIGTLVHYPVPVHLQPAYNRRVLVGNGGLHNTEQLCREILSLPMHPQLSTEQVRRVCGLVEEWTNQRL